MSARAGVPASARAGTPGTATLVAVAAAAALAVTATALVSPVAPLAVLALAGAAALAVARPRTLVLVCLVAIVLSTPLTAVLGGGAGYLDEAAVAVCAVALPVRRLVTLGRLVWFPGTAWFAGWIALGLLSSVVAGVPVAVVAPALLLAVKGLVLAFALAQVPWREGDLATAGRAGAVAAVVMATTGAVNLLAPGAWAHLTTGRAPLAFVAGLPALNGVFEHPAAFSRFCSVLAIGALAHLLVVRRSPGVVALLVACAALAVLSLQVKSVVGLLLTLTVLAARFVRPSRLALAALAVPLVAVVAGPPLVALVGGDLLLYVNPTSARALLALGGITVATRAFPLGVGFGRFGSSVAADDYSPLYYQLGFAGRFGLAPQAGAGQYLNDSQWPAIYAETGWLGAACFVIGLACVAARLLRATSAHESPRVRWVRVTGLGWMLLLVVESLASPVFVSAPSFPFLLAAGGVAASCAAGARLSPAGPPAPGPAARPAPEPAPGSAPGRPGPAPGPPRPAAPAGTAAPR